MKLDIAGLGQRFDGQTVLDGLSCTTGDIQALARQDQNRIAVQSIAQRRHHGRWHFPRGVYAFNTRGKKRLQGGDVEHGRCLRKEG